MIRATHFGKNCKTYEKGAAVPLSHSLSKHSSESVDYRNVVTSADIECQQLIQVNLKALYPSARMVGEEDAIMDDVGDSERLLMPEKIRFISDCNNFISEKRAQQLRTIRYRSFVKYSHEI